MVKQKWGRRRVDNQPYPKTQGKENLPRGLTVVQARKVKATKITFDDKIPKRFGWRTGYYEMLGADPTLGGARDSLRSHSKLEKHPLKIFEATDKLGKQFIVAMKIGGKMRKIGHKGTESYRVHWTYPIRDGRARKHSDIDATSPKEAKEIMAKRIKRGNHPSGKITKAVRLDKGNPCPSGGDSDAEKRRQRLLVKKRQRARKTKRR